jgi:hypothetical protein
MKNENMGYQAPKGHRVDYGFAGVEVEGDWNYCKSHNLWYNNKEQKKLLHYGKPCISTDASFRDGDNHYHTGVLSIGRPTRGKYGKTLSLKAAIRRFNKTYNLPKGMVVDVNHNCYLPKQHKGQKSHSMGYKFVNKNFKVKDVSFEVTKRSFSNNFTFDDKAKELVNLLRENGFLVSVTHSDTYKCEYTDYVEPEHEVAIAYGHGIRVGFTSNDSDGLTTYGISDVLFDRWNWFNKWQQCEGIPKTTPNQEIVNRLIERSLEMEMEDEKYDNR